MRKIIDQLLEILARKDYEIILNESDDTDTAKSDTSGMMITHTDNEKKYEFSSNSIAQRKESLNLDAEDGAKKYGTYSLYFLTYHSLRNEQEDELSSAIAKKVFHSVLCLFRISVVSQHGATYPEIVVKLEWNTTAENKQSKLSLAMKEMESVKETLDLKAFIYDYQLQLLNPILEPKAERHLFFDVSQVLLNIQNYFTEQPKHTKMRMVSSRVSVSRGSLFTQSSAQGLFDLIRENAETYNLSLFENRQLSNIFFVNLEGVRSDDGRHPIKVLLVHFDDDLYDKMDMIPEEKLSIDKVHLFCLLYSNTLLLVQHFSDE